MKNENNKVLIITSGGDAPGMNLAIRNLVSSFIKNDIEVYLGFQGYKGLFENLIYGPFYIEEINEEKTLINKQDLSHRIKWKDFEYSGSLILSSRFKKLNYNDPDTIQIRDNIFKKGIKNLIVIGGDGSMKGAKVLSEMGVNTFILPATIDNDFLNSTITIGAQSAANTNRLVINSLIATSRTHQAIQIVEIMGRDSAWLTKKSVGYINLLATITNEEKIYSPQEIFDLIYPKIIQNNYVIGSFKYEPLIAIQELIYDTKWYDELIALIKLNTNLNARFTKIGYIQRGAFITSNEIKTVEQFCSHLIEFYLSSSSFEGQYVVVQNEEESFSIVKTF